MDQQTLGILLGMSFLPPLLFAIWVRNHERHQREPIFAVLGLFAYGGTIGVIVAVALSLLLGFGVGDTGDSASGPSLISLVAIAPLAEELAKGLGLRFVRHRILELEDGIIYGAAIGLGFGATENLLYGLRELQTTNFDQALWTIGLRVFSSVLLHAGSTALLGYGYSIHRLRRSSAVNLVPFYILAVAQHSLYNTMVASNYLIGFAAAVVMVMLVTGFLRRRIRTLDAAPQEWSVVRR